MATLDQMDHTYTIALMQHITNRVNVVHKLDTGYQWGGGKTFELNHLTKQVGSGGNALTCI
jgi:hypothetical protein